MQADGLRRRALTGEKTFLDTLLGAWKTNLEAEDYDEDVSVELLATIEEVSPEAYQKMKDDNGWVG